MMNKSVLNELPIVLMDLFVTTYVVIMTIFPNLLFPCSSNKTLKTVTCIIAFMWMIVFPFKDRYIAKLEIKMLKKKIEVLETSKNRYANLAKHLLESNNTLRNMYLSLKSKFASTTLQEIEK